MVLLSMKLWWRGRVGGRYPDRTQLRELRKSVLGQDSLDMGHSPYFLPRRCPN